MSRSSRFMACGFIFSNEAAALQHANKPLNEKVSAAGNAQQTPALGSRIAQNQKQDRCGASIEAGGDGHENPRVHALNNITARLATADDFRAFFGREPPAIWFGLTAERDGKLLGMGVVRWDEWGRAWGSFDAGDGGVSPMLMHRAARSALNTLREVGEPVIYTFCDTAIPRAAAWLARLGFALDPTLSTPDAPVWSRRLNG